MRRLVRWLRRRRVDGWRCGICRYAGARCKEEWDSIDRERYLRKHTGRYTLEHPCPRGAALYGRGMERERALKGWGL